MKGRGFRGGSEEKMRRMWFGLEIDVVGLPPLPDVSAFDALNDYTWQRHLAEKRRLSALYKKTNN